MSEPVGFLGMPAIFHVINLAAAVYFFLGEIALGHALKIGLRPSMAIVLGLCWPAVFVLRSRRK